MLLAEYARALYHTPSKKEFILKPLNILGLIASIPHDFILFTFMPGFGLLKFFKLFELSRILLLPVRVKFVRKFCEKTGLHKIFGVIFTIIIIFTLLFDLYGPSYNGFDDFYFVIFTLTTVGYGDVTPITYNEKILAIILILIGIFIFSTITASMASFLTDRMIEKEDKDTKEEINKNIEEKTEDIMNELKTVQRENKELKDEINELKNLIKKEK